MTSPASDGPEILPSAPRRPTEQSNPVEPPRRQYTCLQCNERYSSRAKLYEHQMLAHRQFGSGLHSDIYDENNAPWISEHGIDEYLRHVYRVNRPLILETFREGAVESVYNFPIGNTTTVGQLMALANAVYNRQRTAFKLNVNFGYILRSRETEELRYFKPFDHEGLFGTPIYISRRLDLKKLMGRLQSIDVMEHLMQQRPDTKWVVELVTNIRFHLFKTTHLLSGTRGKIPDHVKNNRAVYSLVSDKRSGKPFDDYFCAFRCLALHKGFQLTNLEAPTKRFFQEWKKFKQLDKPFRGSAAGRRHSII